MKHLVSFYACTFTLNVFAREKRWISFLLSASLVLSAAIVALDFACLCVALVIHWHLFHRQGNQLDVLFLFFDDEMFQSAQAPSMSAIKQLHDSLFMHVQT